MLRSLFRKFALVLLFTQAFPALAQWQTPQYSIPVGKGTGFTGFDNAAPGTAGNALTSNGPLAKPTFKPVPGTLNAVTPEQFYQSSDGADWGLAWRRAVTYLTGIGGGKVIGGCNTTYTISSLLSNAMIVPASSVILAGCGIGSTIIKMADGVNTSSVSFANGIYTSGTANGVTVQDITIDMNGANNSCSGTCYHSNAALGIGTFDFSNVYNVEIINNPGSNDTVYGTNTQPPTGNNLNINNLFHKNSGDRVNAASLDFSADFFIAKNVTIGMIRYQDGPVVNGSAFELHGTNIIAGRFVVDKYFNCGIIAAEPAGVASITSNVILDQVACNDVKNGIQTYSKAGSTDTNFLIGKVAINYLTGSSGITVDACSNMNAASVGNTNLQIKEIIHNSDVTGNLGNEAPVVSVCRWKNSNIGSIVGVNSQGPVVSYDNIITGANITIESVSFENPGRTTTAANQVGARFINTSGNTAGNISINGFKTSGTVQYNISSNVNATQASIDSVSLASGATLGQWNVPAAWSGTIWPQAQINFRGTGGAGQFVKQATAAGALTVSAPTVSEIAGLAAGCATWLGTASSANLAACLTDETGTAGSAVFSVSPALTGTPTTPTAAADTNTTQIASTAFVIGQVGTTTPLVDSGSGAVGGSVKYARADHQHPAHNTYSQIMFATGNLNAQTQNTTWFFNTAENVTTEAVVQMPMSQAGTIDKLYCSMGSAAASGQTVAFTLRKNGANAGSPAITCTPANLATTCNDTTHSVSVVAGDLINMQAVTSATSGTITGMNCGVRLTTTSP